MAEFKNILNLMSEVAPDPEKSSLEEIIRLNGGQLGEKLLEAIRAQDQLTDHELKDLDVSKFVDSPTLLFKREQIESLVKDPKQELLQASLNKKRLQVMKFMIKFRLKEHIEMLDVGAFREILNAQVLKVLLSRSKFVNFTIQEKQLNPLLGLQGYYLKNFIYFHIKVDMKFRATIDSSTIDMDNPYTRNTIREENRKDPELGHKYVEQLDVENFCLELLDKFFPDIAGIWADHSHYMPYYVIEFIKLCFEMGLVTPASALKILTSLQKITVNLVRLEEAWLDRLNEVSKLSEMLKANNITNMFAKCRENMAYLLIQIMVLLADTAFLEQYPLFVAQMGGRTTLPLAKLKRLAHPEDGPDYEDFVKEFMFFKKEINDPLMFITMNYLSSTVYISLQKSMNPSSRMAIERIFMYLTTTNRDAFLNSLKQVKGGDLKFFDTVDVIHREARDICDDLGHTMRKLLDVVSKNGFDRSTGAMDPNFKADERFEKFLRSFIPLDHPTLPLVVERVLDFINKNSKMYPDFYTALVKESVPLSFVALVNYTNEYFEAKVKTINKTIFEHLLNYCTNNTYCKAQIFKGDSLFHLKKLLHRPDKNTYLFINRLCQEEDIAFYLGRDLFGEIVGIFEKFNKTVSKEVFGFSQKANGERKFNKEDEFDHLSFNDNCAIFILMSKIITKIFRKTFLNEREKLQSALLAQEAIFPSLSNFYLPKMIELLNDPDLNQATQAKDAFVLHKKLFLDESEAQLVEVLEGRELTPVDRKLLLLNTCFALFKAFNTVCADAYSAGVRSEMKEVLGVLPKLDQTIGAFDEDSNDEIDLLGGPATQDGPVTLLSYLARSPSKRARQVEPFGLESEMVTFVRLFALNPEDHCIIESKFDGKQNPDKYNQVFISLCLKRVTYYNSPKQDKDEARLFLLEGLFPVILRMLNSIKNMCNYERVTALTANSDRVKYLMNRLNENIPLFNNICGKKVVEEDEFTVNNSSGRLLEKDDARLSSKRLRLPSNNDAKEKKPMESQDTSLSKIQRLVEQCNIILEFIKRFYEDLDGPQDAFRRFNEEKNLTKEEFNQLTYAAKFNETSLTPEIKLKKKVLNVYIKLYQTAKEDFFEKPDEPNLMSHFDRNVQNLRGIFSSAVDRLLSRNKLEKRSSVVSSLSHDFSISRFWMSPSCYAYVNMLQRVITQSKTARKEFFAFLSEDEEEQEVENKHYQKGPYDVAELVKRPRNNLVAVLLRIHTDLITFLNSNPIQTMLWWICHDIYVMLNEFFQNLCERNFMDFKVFFGTFIPKFSDEGWRSLEGKTIMRVLVSQLSYLIGSSRLSKNKDPVLIHTDQLEKTKPLLDPLIDVINEAVTGPCVVNQNILMEIQLDGLINICTRIVDELDSEYNELVDSTLTLLLSLCEGYDVQILKALATKIPSSILVDRISRVTKKLYIKELIESGKFEREAKKKYFNSIQQESLLASSSKKPASSSAETAKEKTPSNPNQSIELTKKLDQHEHTALIDGLVKAVISGQSLEKKSFTITEEMESMVEIEDWEDLYDLYMKGEEFGDSRQFHYIFKIMILWQNLARQSKNHKSRIEDAEYETEQYFKKIDLFGFVTGGNEKKPAKSGNMAAGEKKKVRPPEFTCIFYFISKKIITELEIVDPNRKPVKVYFPKSPPSFMLSEEAKNAYREECEIADSNTKMLNLMRNFNLFNILMTRDLATWRRIGFFFEFLSDDAFKKYTFACWLMGLAINIIIVASIKISDSGETVVYKSAKSELAVRVFGYLLVGVSALFLFIWLLFKYKRTYLTRLEDYIFDHPGVSSSSLKARLYVMVFPAFINQPIPMNYLFHLIFTIVGIEYTIFCMALNLLLIVNISKTTQFVLKSITLHVDQLVQTLILAIFVIFAYTMVLGNTLVSQINEGLNQPCQKLVECLFFTINLGLRNGGGIAESLSDVKRDDRFNTRSVFDVTFFMLINVISLNIIFGIIIDTFSQLRDEQNERSKPRCYQRSTRRTTASSAETRVSPSARWPETSTSTSPPNTTSGSTSTTSATSRRQEKTTSAASSTSCGPSSSRRRPSGSPSATPST